MSGTDMQHKACWGGGGGRGREPVSPATRRRSQFQRRKSQRPQGSDHGLGALEAVKLDVQCKVFIFCFEIPLGQPKPLHVGILLAAGDRKPRFSYLNKNECSHKQEDKRHGGDHVG